MTDRNLSKFQAALDADTVIYHPKWNNFTGSPIATLILQDVNYWWWGHWPGHDPGTPFYREESEWLDRLQVGRKMFINHRDKVGRQIKVGEGEQHTDVFEEGYLIAWMTDQSRKTWYWLNVNELDRQLSNLYFPESPKGIQETSPESPKGIQRIPKRDSASTETTTKTTNNNNGKLGAEVTLSLETETGVPIDDAVLVAIDDAGNFLPEPVWNKHDPLFRRVMELSGLNYKNIQGQMRRQWLDTVHHRAREDTQWRAWVIWQATHNSQGQRFKDLMKNVADELNYQSWLEGNYKPVSELRLLGVKKGTNHPRPEPEPRPISWHDADMPDWDYDDPEFDIKWLRYGFDPRTLEDDTAYWRCIKLKEGHTREMWLKMIDGINEKTPTVSHS